MDIFISWSGERSRAAAEALHGWLPKVINAIKPWLSSEDIDKGARWSTDVASRLETAKAGIICLTPSNLHSDWILFEAGALSKTLKNTFVCPFLIGIGPSDVKPPLAQFQATRAIKEEVLKLLKTLNNALGDTGLTETHIDEAFDVWWPKLDAQLKALPKEESKGRPHRSDRELLEELLALVRNQNRLSNARSIEPELAHIKRTMSYPISANNLFFQKVNDEAERYGTRVVTMAQVEPNDPRNRSYFIQLESGTDIILEIPHESSVHKMASRLASDLAQFLPPAQTGSPVPES